MKKLFIFDLDNTLGRKTPSWPAITRLNADFLRQLADSGGNLMFFATGRPRSQAFLAFRHGGISGEEVYKIFPGGVYEDGHFVESREKVLYNSVNESAEIFRKAKSGFFDDEAKSFFRENGFLLFPGFILRGKESPFAVLDYSEQNTGSELTVPELIPLYQQGNDVRETYKLPQEFLDDSLQAQKPIFQEVRKTVLAYLGLRFPNWQEGEELVTWEDAVEIYPKLKGKHFLKGEGLAKLLPYTDSRIKVYVCCDGRN